MRRWLLLSVLWLAALPAGARGGEDRLDRLPRLRLPTLDGEMLATWDLGGSKVLLVEFASW